MKGIVPLAELLCWYQSWNMKILPKTVRIMGGEPLLHPHLETILYETRNHWKDSKIELITNGLLLPQVEVSVFDALKEIGATVIVSKHFDDQHYNAMIRTGINALKRHGIIPYVLQSGQSWRKFYRLDEQGCAVPYQSDPAKAWSICLAKNCYTTLIDNCLYRCPQLGCYSYAAKKGFVSEDWKAVLNYEPLKPSCTQDELKAFMHEGPCEQCSVCPEQFQYATKYEKINPFGIPSIRKHFCSASHQDSEKES